MRGKLGLIHAAFAVFSSVASCIGAQAQQALTPDQMIGAWKVKTNVIHDIANNSDAPNFAGTPEGYSMYAKEGTRLRMIYFVIGSGRQKPAAPPSESEAAKLFASMNAYSGVLELSTNITSQGTRGKVTVDVAGNPNNLGPQERFYSIGGNTLTVSTEAFVNPRTGRNSYITVTYDRVM